MTRSHVETWEKPKIRELIWLFGITGIVGMVAIGVIAKAMGWNLYLMFLPWMAMGIKYIQEAYHQGVCDEREHRVNEEQKGDNP